MPYRSYNTQIFRLEYGVYLLDTKMGLACDKTNMTFKVEKEVYVDP